MCIRDSRIIDANITGVSNIDKITHGSVTAIGITGIMRYLLFLACLLYTSRCV